MLFNTKSASTPTLMSQATPHKKAGGLFLIPLRVSCNSLAVQTQVDDFTSLSQSFFKGSGGKYS